MEPYPASPESSHNPNDKGPRPASVDTAVKLIWAGVAFGLISTILSFTMIDDLVDQAREAGGSAISEDAARTGAIIGIIVGAIISVALGALFAYFIAKGANWARIVYTVLAVLGLVFGLIGIGNQPGLFLVLSLISFALTIATLFFLYRPESNAYFKAKPVA